MKFLRELCRRIAILLFFSLFSSAVMALEFGPGVNLSLIKLDDSGRLSDVESAGLISSGFKHVRIPVRGDNFFLAGKEEDYRIAVGSRVESALKAGFFVTLDMHPSPSFKRDLISSDVSRSRFLKLWETLASAYKNKYHDQLAFEILNEPGDWSRADWWSFQLLVIEAIRDIDPSRIVVASGARMSTVEDLVSNRPYGIPNIVYNFHFYYPMSFTHKGADWTKYGRSNATSVVWPKGAGANSASKNTYGSSEYGRKYIDRYISKIAAWRDKYGVIVICNEFGVHVIDDEDSRLNYLEDVTRAFRDSNIDWTIWQYSGGFGIAKDGVLNKRVVDRLVFH